MNGNWILDINKIIDILSGDNERTPFVLRDHVVKNLQVKHQNRSEAEKQISDRRRELMCCAMLTMVF